MTTFGIVTEGETEVYCLPQMQKQLEDRTGIRLLRPLRATVDPLAPIPVLVRGLLQRVRLAKSNGADVVVVLIDRETSPEHPGSRSALVEQALQAELGQWVRVVIKDSTFENWLVASPEAFEKQKARYPKSELIRKAVEPDRADRVVALQLIKRAIAAAKAYDKIQDGRKTAALAVVSTMAANSRSFRKFLAVLGDPAYASSSRLP